jgi:hypothetical protein
MVASFNDWNPVTLITAFEMKKVRTEGIELEAWIKK